MALRLLDEVNPAIGERTDVIQIYGDLLLRVGESEQAKEKVLPAVDRLLGAGDVGRAAALIKRLLGSAPGDIEVLERAARVFDRRDDPDMANSIEASLADSYFRAGRNDKALRLYRGLAQREPENSLFVQRIETLGGLPATSSRVATPGPSPIPASPDRLVQPSRETGPRQEPVPEADIEFVDVEFTDEASEPTGEIAQPESSLYGVSSSPNQSASPLPLPAAPTTAMELFTEAVVFAKYGLVDKAVGHLHRVLALEPTHQAARDLLGTLGGGEVAEVEFGASAPAAVASQAELAPEAELSFEPGFLSAPSVSPDASGPAPAPQVPIGALAAAEEVATPNADPPIDLAVPAPLLPSPTPRPGLAPVRLENLEAMLGLGEAPGKAAKAVKPRPARPSVDELIGLDLAGLVGASSRPQAPAPPLEWGTETPLGPASPQGRAPAAPVLEGAPPVESPPAGTGEAETVEEPVELLEVSEMLGGPPEEHLREIDFFIEQGLLDEAARQLGKLREQFPDHAEVNSRQALLKARGWEEGALTKAVETSAAELFSEEEQFFDLAAELEKELAEDELVAEARGTEGSGEVSIEDLFKEFQRGVAEQIHEEDYDTHFNLGLAYREMGLLDEAIGEFQLASKSASLFIEASSMIGASYLDKGLPEQAAEWYSRALTAPELPPEAELGLKYELGRALEAAGNLSGALMNFIEVLALNPGFRDVVDRVSRLQITH